MYIDTSYSCSFAIQCHFETHLNQHEIFHLQMYILQVPDFSFTLCPVII